MVNGLEAIDANSISIDREKARIKRRELKVLGKRQHKVVSKQRKLKRE